KSRVQTPIPTPQNTSGNISGNCGSRRRRLHPQKPLTVHRPCRRPQNATPSRKRGVAGSDWEARSHKLWDSLARGDREVLGAPPDENVYDNWNRYMLTLAEELAEHLRLIALWDGK